MEFRDRYQYDPKTDFIAKGGFAKVYKAYDTMMDRTVALKVYSHEVSARYDLVADMKRGSRLDHANLCRYYDVAVFKKETAFGEEETQQVGVMEYLDSGNIKDYHKEHPKYLLKLLTDVLQGLSYLHEHGLIHRDIKPQNILIKQTTKGPVAKITDFGISKVADSNATTKSSSLLGSIEYMAPEQFNPQKYGIKGKISYNLDLWSFGCLTYELLTGGSVFGEKLRELSTEQVLIKMLDEIDYTRINSLPEPYSIIGKCLVKDANLRIKKADDLIEYFNSYALKTKLESSTNKEPAVKTDSGKAVEETTVVPIEKKSNEVSDQGTILPDTGDGYDPGTQTGASSEPGTEKKNSKLPFVAAMILIVISAGCLLYISFKNPTDQKGTGATTPNKNHEAPITDSSSKTSGPPIDTAYTPPVKAPTDNSIVKQVVQKNAGSELKSLWGLYDQAGDEYDYYGEVKNGKPSGYGYAEYKNGDTYLGQYKNGMMSGKGTYTWASGYKYTGQWKGDLENGEGQLYDDKGDLQYDGMFENGKEVDDTDTGTDKEASDTRNGYYVVKYDNGLYEGYYVNGLMDGQGTYTWSDGDKYTGSWKKGLMQGYGVYTANEDRQIKNCPDCVTYKGYYSDNEKNGFGRCYDKSGNLLYEGQFKDGMPVDNYPNQ